MRQPPKFACNFLRDTSLVGGNPTAVSSSIALPFASVLTMVADISNVLAFHLFCYVWFGKNIVRRAHMTLPHTSNGVQPDALPA